MTVREAGRKGGQTTSERHGPQFYEEIGRIGGQKVKRLIAAGKREEG
jgi:general stress protein YciG